MPPIIPRMALANEAALWVFALVLLPLAAAYYAPMPIGALIPGGAIAPLVGYRMGLIPVRLKEYEIILGAVFATVLAFCITITYRTLMLAFLA